MHAGSRFIRALMSLPREQSPRPFPRSAADSRRGKHRRAFSPVPRRVKYALALSSPADDDDLPRQDSLFMVA